MVFESKFPFGIVEWQESYQGGYGSKTKAMTTRAVRLNTLLMDYRNKNRNTDTSYRERLGLE